LNQALQGRSGLALASVFLLVCIGLLLTRFAAQKLVIRLTRNEVYRLTIQLSREILTTSLRRIEKLTAPRIFAALTDDVLIIANAFEVLALLLAALASCAAVLGYIAFLSPTALAVVLSFVIGGAIVYRRTARVAYAHFARGRAEQDALFGHLRAMTEGAKELRLSREGRGDFEAELLEPTANRSRQHMIAGLDVAIGGMTWGEVWFFVVIGFVAIVMPQLTATPGPVVSGVSLCLIYLIGPVTTVFKLLPNLTRAGVALDNVHALGLALRDAPDPIAPSQGVASLRFEHELRAKGLTFSYEGEGPDSGFALGPLDLALRPREILFVVGGNGSGKSTLAKLLTGLYPPTSGQLVLDHEPITEATRAAYRELFSAVFSDGWVFDRLLGSARGGSAADVGNLLRRLRLEGRVEVRDGAFSTTDLSQGQRRRLALLSAFLEDRPIYVFDEWAADQDPSFKQVFYCEFIPELKRRGRSVVCITHDDRYFEIADRVVKLEAGAIVDEWNN
jgi:putative ATP-binding cassette transporter